MSFKLIQSKVENRKLKF